MKIPEYLRLVADKVEAAIAQGDNAEVKRLLEVLAAAISDALQKAE